MNPTPQAFGATWKGKRTDGENLMNVLTRSRIPVRRQQSEQMADGYVR
jgi:hypothetical protein